MGQAKTLTLYKNGKKATTVRKSAAEQRLRMVWYTLKAIFDCIYQYMKYIWDHNPVYVLSRRHRRLYFVENYGEMMIKPKFSERILDLLLSDYRRRQRLLNWVHARVGSHALVYDFSTCWQDGTALCALLESICPGVCPSFHLLSGHNRVKNCRLGLKLANKYLYVPMDLISAEEFVIANRSSEQKIIQYISMVKWASENIKEKWSTLHESLIAAKTGRCFAKGSGLKSGVVEKRSKFTILVSDTIGVFNLLIEVRGPNHEYCGERIVSLHQAKALLDQSFDYDGPQSENIKYLEDCAGNTFVRKKVPARYGSTGEMIYLDVQCGEEGTFYVTFVPTRAGMHAVAVKWQNHHVENSPFRIKVYKASNVSTKSMKGAQEKRVIYDTLSFSNHSGESINLEQPEDSEAQLGADSNRSMSAVAKAKAYSKGRQLTVTRRRVLRRIITRNGEDIVIEEAISPSLSRQSSITDNSDDDSRHQRNEDGGTSELPNNQPIKTLPKVLCTVLEERQGSKDGEHHSGSNHYQSTMTTTSKYTCTEINEHNRLDDDSANHEHTENDSNQDGTSKPVMSLFEKHAHDKAVISNKRSALKRAPSLHHPYKVSARRTQSDGPLYKPQQQHHVNDIYNHVDMSDTSSEMSSEDLLKESGTKNHTVKLLYSGSIKKACMYVCEKAVTNTPQNSTEVNEAANFDKCLSISPTEKTKLHSTQSLPIMRRYWTREVNEDIAAPEMLNTIDNSELSPDTQSTLNDLSDQTYTNNGEFEMKEEEVENLPAECLQAIHEKQSVSSNLERESETDSNTRDIKSGENVFYFNIATHSEVLLNSEHTAKKSGADGMDENGADFPCLNTSNSNATVRANLTRQTQIYCQKSSGDSASVKTDPSSASEDKDNASQSSSSKSGHYCAFKTIYINSNPREKNGTFNDVTIIIPRAKTDKSCQVSDDEIKRETGWDIVEKTYLLLRRISIKIPCYSSDVISGPPFSDNQTNRLSTDSIANEQLLQVPHIPVLNTDYPNRQKNVNDVHEINQNNRTSRATETHTNHKNVNAWFERNNILNRSNTFGQVRQYTIETVDSGFDDNQNSSHVNRHGRLSLPSLLSDNGHTRLYRRPYRGPKIPLEPSLVNSTSSQSISLDKREAGNDADDELVEPETPIEVCKHQRRRQRRINREDSFSLSDSELNERRKRIWYRRHTVDHSSSQKTDSNLSIDRGTHRRNFSAAFRALLERRRENLEDENLAENTDEFHNVDDEFVTSSISSDGDVIKIPSIPKLTTMRLQTLTSVDSNYQGFGLSKSTRHDFLAQLNAFRNICPTDETTEEEILEAKITHWEDTAQVIPYSDHDTGDDLEHCDDHNNDSLESDVDLNKDYFNDVVVGDNTTYEASEDFISDAPDSLLNSTELSFAMEENDPDSPKHSPSILNDEHVSTYFDIFTSFDHSDMPDYVSLNDVAMLGDVISMTTNSGEQMLVRVAGAGLRYGEVGVNNTFQVS
ncbi:hypothetical protein ACF0H5_016747 [Mactra antiquata]